MADDQRNPGPAEDDRRESQRVPIELLVRDAARGRLLRAVPREPRPRRRLLRRVPPAGREPPRGALPRARAAARRSARWARCSASRGRARVRGPREVRRDLPSTRSSPSRATCRRRDGGEGRAPPAPTAVEARRDGARGAAAGLRAVLAVPGGRRGPRRAARCTPGANVENASYGLTLCAERVAVGAAVAAGARRLDAVAVASGTEEPTPPCGVCLQTLAEFGGPDLPVVLAGAGGRAASRPRSGSSCRAASRSAISATATFDSGRRGLMIGGGMEVFRSLEEVEARGALRGCAVAIGNFDGVHLGHRRLLALARERAAARRRSGGGPHLRAAPGARAPARRSRPPSSLRSRASSSSSPSCGMDATVVQPFDLA